MIELVFNFHRLRLLSVFSPLQRIFPYVFLLCWVSRLSCECFLLLNLKFVVSKIVTDFCLSANCLLAIVRSCSRGYFSKYFFFPRRISVEKRFFYLSFILWSSGICWDFWHWFFPLLVLSLLQRKRYRIIFLEIRITLVTKDFFLFLQLISLCYCSCRISKTEFILFSSIWGGSRTGAGTGEEPPDCPAARRDPPGSGDQGRSFSTGVDHYFREGESIRHAHLSIIVNKIVN